MAELHLDKLSVNQIKAAGDPDFLTPEQTAQKFVPGNARTGQSLMIRLVAILSLSPLE